MPANASRKNRIGWLPKKYHAPAAYKIPVPNSTNGYCHERTVPQERHRAFWIKKLKTGISSSVVSCLPHDSQRDLPENFSPLAPRRITTFRKLPTTRPNKNVAATTDITRISPQISRISYSHYP